MITIRESSRRCWEAVGPQVHLTRQEYPRTRPHRARIVGILYQRRVHWPRHGLIREIWPYIIIRLCFRRWSQTSARMRAAAIRFAWTVDFGLPALTSVASRPDVTTLIHESEILGDKPAISVFVRYLKKKRNSGKKRSQNSLARIHATHLARNVTVSSGDLFV